MQLHENSEVDKPGLKYSVSGTHAVKRGSGGWGKWTERDGRVRVRTMSEGNERGRDIFAAGSKNLELAPQPFIVA